MIKVIADDIKTISIEAAIKTNSHKNFIIVDKLGDKFFLVRFYDTFLLVKNENYMVYKSFKLYSIDKVLSELLESGYNIYIKE